MWQEEAKCKKMDPNLFFPDGHGGRTSEEAEKRDRDSAERRIANIVCNADPVCEVRDECLAHAMKNHERGVWGGTTSEERRSMRRKMRRKANVA